MRSVRAVQFAIIVLILGVAAWAQEYPRVEIGGDYSYVRFEPVASGTNGLSLNGGGGTFDVNINRYLGIKMDLQGYGSNNVTWNKNGTVLNAQGNLFTYLFGPQVKIRAHRFQPYFHLLLGGAHSNVYGNLFHSCTGVLFGSCSITKAPASDAFALVAGLGLDIPINRRVQFRPVGVDYLMTDFTNQINNSAQSNFRYTGGLVFTLGGPSPVPPKAACTVHPQEVLPWEGPVTATAEPSDFNPKHNLDFNWNSNGGAVSGQGRTATMDTASLAPGEYVISANVSDPKRKKLNSASCSTSFKVRQPQPPQVGCSASPSSVHPGEPITVSVHGSSPDRSRITDRNFSATAGALKEGQTSAGAEPGQFTTTATLDTTNAPPGPLSVNVNVKDEHGFGSNCVATASVVAPPPPAAPEVVSETLVNSCEFKNEHKLARVDNECKAVLDEVALRLQQEPNGKLVIVGYADEEIEAQVNDVESLRAANTKSYLTTGEAKQQIDPNRIEVRKSSDRNSGNTAKFYFVPQGGSFTVKDTTIVDESSLPQDRTGAPKK